MTNENDISPTPPTPGAPAPGPAPVAEPSISVPSEPPIPSENPVPPESPEPAASAATIPPEPSTVPIPPANPELAAPAPAIATPRRSKRKLFLALGIIILLIIIAVVVFFVHDHLENQRLDVESVLLKSDLTVKFGTPLKVSDCLADLRGELVDDFTINTEQLGDQEINFEYINIKNRKRPSKFTLSVVDTTKPKVFGGTSYTLYTGYDGELTDLMMSVDDIDDRPAREIRGQYNLEKPGTYQLEYVITDASGNQTVKPFTLKIIERPADGGDDEPPARTELTALSRIIRLQKTDQNHIGIDVSQWQGEIDWPKVKAAGVEFAMLRIGYQYGFGGENVLDPYFKANLAAAKEQHLPVGVYFYSYARTPDEAKSQADWITELLKGVDLELGIAFDWESWSAFNSAKMSLYTINKTAETFLSAVQSAGYKPLLYSSKNYLELIWQPDQLAAKLSDDFAVWLAQYHEYVTYKGKYQMWQMSDSGGVPGIDGAVDIDILYK